MAESANDLFREGSYDNLIDFEADIASISERVILIAESPGSLAELGAFTVIGEISKRLTVVLQEE